MTGSLPPAMHAISRDTSIRIARTENVQYPPDNILSTSAWADVVMPNKEYTIQQKPYQISSQRGYKRQ